MTENFYEDNKDIAFHLHHLKLDEITRLKEQNWTQNKDFPKAPANFSQAINMYESEIHNIGKISAEKIFPRSSQVDRDNVELIDGVVHLPQGTKDNIADLTNAGLMGVTLPREYGGKNYPATIYSMMTEIVARADASLQNLFGLQDIAETIYRFGNDKQKNRLLPKFARGEVDGAMALTEPDAGSDLQSVQTTATYDEEKDQWFLNGKKRFITNGCAKVVLVLARSEQDSHDGRGLSMFILEKCPQVTVDALEHKMGIHGSPTCELTFHNAPCELVGRRRRGLTRYVMSLMNGARLAISSQAVGLAEAALRCTLEYTARRSQFGKQICDIIPVNEMLTRMKAQTMAARTLLYETCKYVDLRDCYEDRINRGIDELGECKLQKKYSAIADALTPLTKYFNTETCNQVCYDAIQCHGGKGFMKDHLAERYYRDARITNIYEGTSQMQVVAAILGVKKRILTPLFDELEAIDYPGKLAELSEQISTARKRSEEALAFAEETFSTEEFELMARHIVRMHALSFISALLLRDANADSSRLCLVERFLNDAIPEINMHYEILKKGENGILTNRQSLMAL